jgi:hypothetical protein
MERSGCRENENMEAPKVAITRHNCYPIPAFPPPLQDALRKPVEGQVEPEDIHARFTKDSELASSSVLFDQSPHLVLAQPACARDARQLVERRGYADMWVEAWRTP